QRKAFGAEVFPELIQPFHRALEERGSEESEHEEFEGIGRKGFAVPDGQSDREEAEERIGDAEAVDHGSRPRRMEKHLVLKEKIKDDDAGGDERRRDFFPG